MKIAFLNIYNGVVDRGAETFVKELASMLSQSHEVSVFQSGKAAGEPYKVLEIPVSWDWKQKSAAGTLLGLLFLDYFSRQILIFSLKAFWPILKKRYDVVIPVNGGWMPAILRIVTWLNGSKMIISGQSGKGWDDRNNLWCFPDTFVALSTRAKLWAKKANPFVKIEYIPNGVDTKKFTPDGETLKINLKKPIVLCVGALTKTKRIELAIQAVAKLKNVSLLVCGDGDLRSEIYNLGSRLLGERFQLIKMPYKDMPKVYRTADIFTIPSESYYAFENVIVEAMASGLPVVANNDDIRREIVGRAGVLVDPINTDAYAIALENAMRLKWGKRPQNQAKKFDWDKIAGQYQKLLNRI
jgi:glycosyltransferase involved in cell wall biosynthesis